MLSELLVGFLTTSNPYFTQLAQRKKENPWSLIPRIWPCIFKIFQNSYLGVNDWLQIYASDWSAPSKPHAHPGDVEQSRGLALYTSV